MGELGKNVLVANWIELQMVLEWFRDHFLSMAICLCMDEIGRFRKMDYCFFLFDEWRMDNLELVEWKGALTKILQVSVDSQRH
jgi:hypothetical protein